MKVYKHWDGYEYATLPWLEEFNKTFTEARGDDPDYKLAQLLRSSAFDAQKYKLDSSRDTGGVSSPSTQRCGRSTSITSMQTEACP